MSEVIQPRIEAEAASDPGVYTKMASQPGGGRS
jgi:hypothetical protein